MINQAQRLLNTGLSGNALTAKAKGLAVRTFMSQSGYDFGIKYEFKDESELFILDDGSAYEVAK